MVLIQNGYGVAGGGAADKHAGERGEFSQSLGLYDASDK